MRVLLISGSTRSRSGNSAALATAAAMAPSRVAAVLFCTPEYAGNLPGSLKNLLDWTVGGGELYGKPAAWINVAAQGRGTGASDALAAVLEYVGAVIVEGACRHIPVDRAAIGPDGAVTDPGFWAAMAEVWNALLRHLDQAGQSLPAMS